MVKFTKVEPITTSTVLSAFRLLFVEPPEVSRIECCGFCYAFRLLLPQWAYISLRQPIQLLLLLYLGGFVETCLTKPTTEGTRLNSMSLSSE